MFKCFSSRLRFRRIYKSQLLILLIFIMLVGFLKNPTYFLCSSIGRKLEEHKPTISEYSEETSPGSRQEEFRELSSDTHYFSSLVPLKMSELPGLPYIFPNGSFMLGPQDQRNFPIHPEESPGYDRLLEQSLFNPSAAQNAEMKTIIVTSGFGWFRSGREPFLRCPVKNCFLGRPNEVLLEEGDLVVFINDVFMQRTHKHSHQTWVLYILESPLHAHERSSPSHSVNWTATYRLDSDIVTPYSKWMYFDERIQSNPIILHNLAQNKTKKVAWLVSNCNAKNARMLYAQELSKYIQVDIFGDCGQLKCPKDKSSQCLEMLRKNYKFYLSFENSNCKDYITEKFFLNALRNNLIPIVMGADKDDYLKVAPLNSFLHVDDFDSPKALAEKLHEIDADDHKFNAYFEWHGTGDFVDTNFMCVLCGMLHDPDKRTKSYEDTLTWWHGNACKHKSVGSRECVEKPERSILARAPHMKKYDASGTKVQHGTRLPPGGTGKRRYTMKGRANDARAIYTADTKLGLESRAGIT
ncbi:unnamed protein product [Notodromas monacha]|uniref:Fucosyltransferase n=1 Tax=Notodromas monacha TaxID=399045 RepID=A0A7R9BXQ4_9CRUS|nr:unnamed protein product [Notodromas monacha]CAG0922169.1 unnamed protein product [Notodromas monacha]